MAADGTAAVPTNIPRMGGTLRKNNGPSVRRPIDTRLASKRSARLQAVAGYSWHGLLLHLRATM